MTLANQINKLSRIVKGGTSVPPEIIEIFNDLKKEFPKAGVSFSKGVSPGQCAFNFQPIGTYYIRTHSQSGLDYSNLIDSFHNPNVVHSFYIDNEHFFNQTKPIAPVQIILLVRKIASKSDELSLLFQYGTNYDNFKFDLINADKYYKEYEEKIYLLRAKAKIYNDALKKAEPILDEYASQIQVAKSKTYVDFAKNPKLLPDYKLISMIHNLIARL